MLKVARLLAGHGRHRGAKPRRLRFHRWPVCMWWNNILHLYTSCCRVTSVVTGSFRVTYNNAQIVTVDECVFNSKGKQ